jgi:hypothetical protein
MLDDEEGWLKGREEVGSVPMEMRYFSCVPGRTVARFGTREFIGARRTPDAMLFDPTKIVAIPVTECLRYHREYRNALRRKELIERTKADWDAAQGALREVAELQLSGKSDWKSSENGPLEDIQTAAEEIFKNSAPKTPAKRGRRRRRSGGKGTEE